MIASSPTSFSAPSNSPNQILSTPSPHLTSSAPQNHSKMKEDDDAPTLVTIPPTKPNTTTASTTTVLKRESSESVLLGKTRYRFWVLSAILLLAFWSMFTGSVTLKWSAGNLSQRPDNLDFKIQDDLDILEVEEKEKMVRRMWGLYSHSSSASRLPRFWEQAFQAAYEALTSDAPSVRDAAVSEIAKLFISFRNLDDHPFSVQSATSDSKGRKNLKQAKKSKVI